MRKKNWDRKNEECNKKNETTEGDKQTRIVIGNRLVKIRYTSDRKKRKEMRKKTQMCMHRSLKRKKRKAIERKKKYMEFLCEKIKADNENGKFYLLPRYLRKKNKKNKVKKMILLEKEVIREICSEILKQSGPKKKDFPLPLDNNGVYYIISRNSSLRRRFHPIEIKKTNSHDLITYAKYRYTIKLQVHLKLCTEKIEINKSNQEDVRDTHKFLRHLRHFISPSKIVQREEKARKKKRNKTEKKQRKDIPKNNYTDTEMGNENSLNTIIKQEPSPKDLMKEAIMKNDKIMHYIRIAQIEKKIFINDYVENEITEELNELAKDLLKKLCKSHEKLRAKHKKRYYLGLKESYKHICIQDPKLIIIAPNLQPLTNGTLNEMMEKIIVKCREKNIPVVYALSKNLLGKCVNKPRQIIICITDNDSFIEETKALITLAEKLKVQKYIVNNDKLIEENENILKKE